MNNKPNAVAMAGVKPMTCVRPRAPGHLAVDAHWTDAGRAPNENGRQMIFEAQPRVATVRAPGQSCSEAQSSHAGRAPITETVATERVKPGRNLRPRAPGLSHVEPHDWSAGPRTFFIGANKHDRHR